MAALRRRASALAEKTLSRGALEHDLQTVAKLMRRMGITVADNSIAHIDRAVAAWLRGETTAGTRALPPQELLSKGASSSNSTAATPTTPTQVMLQLKDAAPVAATQPCIWVQCPRRRTVSVCRVLPADSYTNKWQEQWAQPASKSQAARQQ